MDTTTIFLFVVFACLGIALGSILTRARQRKPPASGEAEPLALPDGSIEVLRVWRTTDNQLRLGMDGQQLTSANALQPEQRRRLVRLVVDMRPWLETPSEAAPGHEVPERPAGPPKPVMKPVDEMPAPTVLKSIIEQINDLLQAKLEGSPLKSRDIRLMEGPGGAVVVKIGLNKYEGIDAVPEAEIQTLIRQAVAEWEKSAK